MARRQIPRKRFVMIGSWAESRSSLTRGLSRIIPGRTALNRVEETGVDRPEVVMVNLNPMLGFKFPRPLPRLSVSGNDHLLTLADRNDLAVPQSFAITTIKRSNGAGIVHAATGSDWRLWMTLACPALHTFISQVAKDGSHVICWTSRTEMFSWKPDKVTR